MRKNGSQGGRDRGDIIGALAAENEKSALTGGVDLKNTRLLGRAQRKT